MITESSDVQSGHCGSLERNITVSRFSAAGDLTISVHIVSRIASWLAIIRFGWTTNNRCVVCMMVLLHKYDKHKYLHLLCMKLLVFVRVL